MSNELSEIQSRELMGLGAGRNLRWSIQNAAITAAAACPVPEVASAVSAEDAVLARPYLQLRANGVSQVADVEVSAVDTGATYTVTINGTGYDYAATGGDDAAAIAAGLVSALAAASAIVTVTDNLDGTFDIAGATTNAYTIAVSATGSGDLDINAEPSTATFSFWFRDENVPDGYDTWRQYQFADGTYTRTVANNWSENVACNAMEDMYLYVESHDAQGDKALAVLFGVGIRDDGLFDGV